MSNSRSRRRPGRARPAYEQIVLVLQGGGALGAYQAGVYEALAERGLHPNWVAGISIGAINAALIAGNAPERRVDRLRAFWNTVSSDTAWTALAGALGGASRGLANQISAGAAMLGGVPGLFRPRWPAAWLDCAGSWTPYDTAPLRATLERLVDFDRINARALRFSAGAVNIRTGKLVYFDAPAQRIGPEHVMASAALPPGLPPIEIDGEHYWDGGIVSNSPLQWVIRANPRRDTLAFEVDLWSAAGELPRNAVEAMTRHKEIQYANRTRDNVARFAEEEELRGVLAALLRKLPEPLRKSREAALLARAAEQKAYTLVQFAYRAHAAEASSKDYEFSRLSMQEHWRAGYEDAARALARPHALARPEDAKGLVIHDLAHAEDDATAPAQGAAP